MAEKGHKAGLFDLRLIIAVLFGVYGVVLTIVGLGFTDDSDLAKADGLNINLWSGIGMLVVAAFFGVWTFTKPLVVPDELPEETEPEGAR
jgi:drug/metabolite transporter (DMT)-like permease